jgi:mannose-6-phosphate isomerase-like protein (cupin superfamily)
MSLKVRRVVTGKDKNGKAIVAIDGEAARVHERAQLGVTNCLLWVTNSGPARLSEQGDAAEQEIGIVPPPNGTIFRMIQFEPQKDIHTDPQTRLQLFKKMGLAPEGPSAENPRDPRMHRTRTIDYVAILSGEIDMLLDDTEVHLKAGDVVVQRGTNHAWVNRGIEPCRAIFVLVDATD